MSLINGYFCFDDELPDQQTYRTYIEIRCVAYDDMDVRFESKNEKLFQLYYALFNDAECQKVPVLSIICQPAFYCWALILAFAYVWQKKSFSLLPPLALLLAILVTDLLGPVAILRYVYPLITSFPLILFIMYVGARGKWMK